MLKYLQKLYSQNCGHIIQIYICWFFSVNLKLFLLFKILDILILKNHGNHGNEIIKSNKNIVKKKYK